MVVRYWAVALGLLLVAGCTPAVTPTATTQPSGDWTERGPITLAVASGASPAWQPPIEQWNQDHPNEQVTLTEFAGSNGDELASRGESSSGEFTILALEPSWTAEFAAKGWLAPLPSDLFPTEELVPATLPAATWEGQLYSYPAALDASVLYYRKARVSKAAVPRTWDELDEVCQQARQDGANANANASCLITPLGDPEDLATAFTEMVWANGGSLSPGSAAAVDSAAVSAGVERYASGLASGWMPKGALGWSPQRSERAYTSGRSIFYRGWWSESIGLGVGAAKPTVAMTQVPADTTPGVAVLGGQNLGVSAFGQNLGTAAAVIDYLVSAPIQSQLATKSAFGPVRSKLYQDSTLAAELPQLKILQAAVGSAQTIPGGERSRDLVTEVDASIRPALSGNTNVANALSDLEGRLERLE